MREIRQENKTHLPRWAQEDLVLDGCLGIMARVLTKSGFKASIPESTYPATLEDPYWPD